MQKYIAYFRVSTAEQGKSGLGLEAQRTAVAAFTNHCTNCIVGEFTDIASGKDNSRPQLMAAIAAAKATGAKLLIAKLDRLSRNAAFIFTLRDSKVDFVCCDMPDANTLTIGIFATLAQHERELISKRTKAALAAKKAAGYKLGNPTGFTPEAQAKATATKKVKAENNTNTRTAAARMREMIELAQFKKQNLSNKIIAESLNRYNLSTARGGAFTANNVRYLLRTVLAEMNLQKLPRFA